MDPDGELQLSMYRVQVERSEHYDRLRLGLSNLVMLLGSALVGLTTASGEIAANGVWNGALAAVLGAFGFEACRRIGRRSHQHGKRAQALRHALDERYPNAKINALRNETPDAHQSLYTVFMGLHIALVVVGISLAVLAST